MFSISFGEMMVILIMGLLVVGPTKLPAAARFLGHLFGRIQRQVSSVKRDIKREMDLAELREMQDGYRKAAQDFTSAVNTPLDDTERAAQKVIGGGPAQPAAAAAGSTGPKPTPDAS